MELGNFDPLTWVLQTIALYMFMGLLVLMGSEFALALMIGFTVILAGFAVWWLGFKLWLIVAPLSKASPRSAAVRTPDRHIVEIELPDGSEYLVDMPTGGMVEIEIESVNHSTSVKSEERPSEYLA